MTNKMTKLYKENRGFLLFVILMSVFKSAVADWNTVPTGSMKPTIIEGDRIWINKLAYDVRIPFTHTSLMKLADPQRGDVIIFDSEVSDIRLVKRVVGVPGDVIALDNNVLYINGEKLDYETADANNVYQDRKENLAGVEHFIRVHNRGSQLSSFSPVTVPEGHYLAMGDNRDNSSDSRVIGFVPRKEIIGKTETVVMSLNYDNNYLPRAERFFHTL
ncbi:signal peptidase I [Paraneptunicella aestuarii]|nr:signal peptidase I [Paraneptunicella aestuarii]UAA40814.1 signal peptidase I [Paraneptunicella aestuarii]